MPHKVLCPLLMICGLSKTCSVEQLFLCLAPNYEIIAIESPQGIDQATPKISCLPH